MASLGRAAAPSLSSPGRAVIRPGAYKPEKEPGRAGAAMAAAAALPAASSFRFLRRGRRRATVL